MDADGFRPSTGSFGGHPDRTGSRVNRRRPRALSPGRPTGSGGLRYSRDPVASSRRMVGWARGRSLGCPLLAEVVVRCAATDLAQQAPVLLRGPPRIDNSRRCRYGAHFRYTVRRYGTCSPSSTHAIKLPPTLGESNHGPTLPDCRIGGNQSRCYSGNREPCPGRDPEPPPIGNPQLAGALGRQSRYPKFGTALTPVPVNVLPVFKLRRATPLIPRHLIRWPTLWRLTSLPSARNAAWDPWTAMYPTVRGPNRHHPPLALPDLPSSRRRIAVQPVVLLRSPRGIQRRAHARQRQPAPVRHNERIVPLAIDHSTPPPTLPLLQ